MFAPGDIVLIASHPLRSLNGRLAEIIEGFPVSGPNIAIYKLNVGAPRWELALHPWLREPPSVINLLHALSLET